MAGGYASLHRLHVREVQLACFQGGVWELILGLCVGVGELAVDYRIDHEKGFVTVRAHGPIVLQELLDYFDALVVQNAMGYPKLFDAREAIPRLSDDDVMELGARVSAYAAFDPGIFFAKAVTTYSWYDGKSRRHVDFAPFGGKFESELF